VVCARVCDWRRVQGVDGAVPKNEVWYCSKTEFCNWTNNPTMVSKKWWHDEYETRLTVT
jgi:hypothetical protein